MEQDGTFDDNDQSSTGEPIVAKTRKKNNKEHHASMAVAASEPNMSVVLRNAAKNHQSMVNN